MPLFQEQVIYRITKYDPADRDDWGTYRRSEDVSSGYGPVEAAYLAAVTAFAEDTSVTSLTVRDPEVSGFVHFGAERPVAPEVETRLLADL